MIERIMRSLFSSRLMLNNAVLRATPPSLSASLSFSCQKTTCREVGQNKEIKDIRSLFNPPRAVEHPSVGSAPPHPSSRPASLALQHYKSVKQAFTSVPSSELEPHTTVKSYFGLSPHSFGHCASSHPPRLGIVRRRILPQ